jgi:hypothetical protein
MDTQDVERIRFVTRHFKGLRGLADRFPRGLMLVVMGLSNLLLEQLTGNQSKGMVVVVATAMFGGCYFLMRRARSYYRQRFGEVEQRIGANPLALSSLFIAAPADTPERVLASRRRLRGAIVAAFALGTLLFFGAAGFSRATTGRYLLLFCGVEQAAIWLARDRHRSQLHHLALGALLLACAVPGPSRDGSWQVLAGACWMLAGLLDHRQLVRFLPDPSEDLAAVADAGGEAEAALEVQR